MSTASDLVALARWRCDPLHYLRTYPEPEIVFDPTLSDEWWIILEGTGPGTRIIGFCASGSDAAQIVYVHNHWPGDDIVGPGGTRPPSRVPR